MHLCWLTSIFITTICLVTSCTSSPTDPTANARVPGTASPAGTPSASAQVRGTAPPALTPTVTPEATATPTPVPTPTTEPVATGVFATAKPGAGDEVYVDGEDGGTKTLIVIPVHDEPAGPPRTLIHQPATQYAPNAPVDFPLFAETVFGQPLVLQVLGQSGDGDWLLVRAPVLPHNRTVWVRAEHFTIGVTSIRIEADIGYSIDGGLGILRVFDGDTELFNAKFSAGRETRPTALTATYIDQVVDGTTLSPAYGPYVVSTASYSESLPTFGGSGLPVQAIHGIRDELIDQTLGRPSSSGSLHTSWATATQIGELDDIIGAPIIFYDSSQAGGSLDAIQSKPTEPAITKPLSESVLDAPIPSFT